VVELRQHAQQRDRLPEALVPALGPDGVAGALAELLVERLAVAEGQVRDLEVRHGLAVLVERRAEARAERDHHLDPFAADDREALHVRVVAEPGRLVEPAAELDLERVPGPRLVLQVRRGQDATVADHAGEADRHAVVIRQRRHELYQLRDDAVGMRSDRRRDAHLHAEHGARRGDDRRLERGAADVDRERADGRLEQGRGLVPGELAHRLIDRRSFVAI
jgi:hypothetical protein